MSVYTPLSHNEICSFFEPFKLGSVLNYEATETGIENTNYFLTSSQKEHFVLTLFESTTDEDLPSFVELMAHLEGANLPIAAPIADANGNRIHKIKNKPAMLCPRLAGKHIQNPSLIHCEQIGTVMANLHLATADYPENSLTDYTLPWAQQQIPSLLAPSKPRPSKPGLSKQEPSNKSDFLSQSDAALLQDISQRCDQFLKTYHELPSGIIHGDLFYDNALFTSSNGQDILSGVIDFYQSGPGFLIYDLAVAANDWCLDNSKSAGEIVLDRNKVNALIGAYEKNRPLNNIEKKAWPQMLVFSAYRFWISRLLNKLKAENNNSVSNHPIKNPNQFRNLMQSNRRYWTL